MLGACSACRYRLTMREYGSGFAINPVFPENLLNIDIFRKTMRCREVYKSSRPDLLLAPAIFQAIQAAVKPAAAKPE